MAEHRLTLMKRCQDEILNRMETIENQYLQLEADLSQVRDRVNSDYRDQKFMNKRVISLENEVFNKSSSDQNRLMKNQKSQKSKNEN